MYVDDLVLARDDLEEISGNKQSLDNKFKIKDLGNLRYFLGMEIARSKEGISLYQRKYTLDLPQDTGTLGAKPVSTLMDYTLKLSKNLGTFLSDISAYRRLIGKLLYLFHTKPNIAFAVNRLSQFLDASSNVHQ